MVQLPPAGAFLDTQRIISSVGVTQGQHTADLGCGSGYITMTLARAVGKDGVVTAVDVMEEPLQAVRTKAEAAGLTNVQEVRADLEVLGGTKIPDNSQDLSVLANVLFQSQKKEAMIAEDSVLLMNCARTRQRSHRSRWRAACASSAPSMRARITLDCYL